MWSLRKAALALGAIEPSDLAEREADDGGSYVGFADAAVYNAALHAVEDAGLEHGREYSEYAPRDPYDALLAELE